MRRREFMAFLGGAAATWPLSALPQQPDRTIGLLTASPSNDPIAKRSMESLVQGLRDHGLLLERDVRVEFRGGAADPEQAAAAAKELVELKADVIVVGSTPGLAAVARE